MIISFPTVFRHRIRPSREENESHASVCFHEGGRPSKPPPDNSKLAVGWHAIIILARHNNIIMHIPLFDWSPTAGNSDMEQNVAFFLPELDDNIFPRKNWNNIGSWSHACMLAGGRYKMYGGTSWCLSLSSHPIICDHGGYWATNYSQFFQNVLYNTGFIFQIPHHGYRWISFIQFSAA